MNEQIINLCCSPLPESTNLAKILIKAHRNAIDPITVINAVTDWHIKKLEIWRDEVPNFFCSKEVCSRVLRAKYFSYRIVADGVRCYQRVEYSVYINNKVYFLLVATLGFDWYNKIKPIVYIDTSDFEGFRKIIFQKIAWDLFRIPKHKLN
jgi:hypothetical protein